MNVGAMKDKTPIVVYYESLKWELKTKTTYGYRYDERLQTNVKESTRLGYTPLGAELELIDCLLWIVTASAKKTKN